MGKIEIVDGCLAPEKDIFIRYTGPQPWDVWKKIHSGIRPFFHVSAVAMNNEDFRWDRLSPDAVEFFSRWWVKKNMSKHSAMKIQFKLQGRQEKATGNGHFSLKLTGNLVTTFEGWSIFVRPFWMAYSYLFYDKMRRQYVAKCREYLEEFRRELRDQFGLQSTTHGPATIATR